MSEQRMDFLDFLSDVRDQVAQGFAGADGAAEISATITVDYGNRRDTYDVPRMTLHPARGDLVVAREDTPVREVPGALVNRHEHTGERILYLAASLHLEPEPGGSTVYTLTRTEPDESRR